MAPAARAQAAPSQKPVPTLTVLAHPQASRVGDTAVLPTAGPIAVSRKEPGFNSVVGMRRPLTTPLLSRSPVTLLRHRTGMQIDVRGTSTPVRVDGASVANTLAVETADIDRGVVLEFGDHIVLLLHRRQARAAPMVTDDDFGPIGDSDGIRNIRQRIEAHASGDDSVLIRGETGSGKALVAAALHRASPRARRPYIVANMAAIPLALAASELFGHARGAFSGARDAHDGFFERADSGTLFLDAVGDTPDDVQAALLRVLETGEIQAIGANRVRRADVRVVAATDLDVEGAIASGRFRGPVYYRLAQAEIRIPPLRDRRDDVARLLIHFMRIALDKHGFADRLEPPPTEREVWLPAALVATLVRYAGRDPRSL
ncbi:MAG: two-component system nitrogen regulation response regulator GlnG [Myxococcota bacterium]|jgi:two-component system nitrogen regulation response regulator GlnG